MSTNISNAAIELNECINDLFALTDDNIDIFTFVCGCFELTDEEFIAFEDAMYACSDTGNQEAINILVAGLIG